MARFVFTYSQPADPSKKEEDALIAALEGVTVLARIPGIVRVEGAPSAVQAAAKACPKWKCHPERELSSKPPHASHRSAK